MREDVAALNESAAHAEIRGCRAPAFRRSFRHNLRLGGRFYAIGVGNFQQMPEEERERITINGEAVCEVDIHACNLSIFLALTGTQELPEGDLYEGLKLPDGTPIPREAVKNWVVQTSAAGNRSLVGPIRRPRRQRAFGLASFVMLPCALTRLWLT